MSDVRYKKQKCILHYFSSHIQHTRGKVHVWCYLITIQCVVVGFSHHGF